MLKLLSVEPSTRKNKKYCATFSDGTKTHFGDTRYQDYLMHGDPLRRERYWSRHALDQLLDPTSAGALAWFLLWGRSTDLQKNIRTYREHFDI